MATGPSAAKAEMFLIVVAALCLVGAAATLMVQHTAPASTPSATTRSAAPNARFDPFDQGHDRDR